MDVTAEIRPGYYGMMHAGPLFVENRYSDFRRYWPHQTLRNLWKLTQYVDPLRLRMEWLPIPEGNAYTCTVLVGNGKVSLTQSNVKVEIQPLDYIFVQFTTLGGNK